MASSSKDTTDKRIPLKVIEESTNNFATANLIGEGGFGKVYKGKLFWSGEWIDIGARKLHRDYGQGDLEFWHEISMLSSLEHDNLVSFIGYCDEKGQKIIINKYEANESLNKYLKDPNLTWTQRLQICVKLARAMKYLHDDEGHGSSVIHRNIKSSKVLLDQNWEPKLSGFGVSIQNTRARKNRLLLAEVVGTNGYVDPIYEKTGFVTHKSDVYSFGVLLFEIMCGMKAFVPDEQREEDSPQFLVEERSSNNEHTGYGSQPPKLFASDVFNNQPTSYANNHPKLYTDGSPPSFSELQPKSFANSQPTSYADGQPPQFSDAERNSFANSQPTSFANSQPTSFANSLPASDILNKWGTE